MGKRDRAQTRERKEGIRSGVKKEPKAGRKRRVYSPGGRKRDKTRARKENVRLGKRDRATTRERKEGIRLEYTCRE